MQAETTYHAILCKVVAEMRKKRGFNQSEFARKLGIAPSAWSQIENGYGNILSADRLAQVAELLGVKPGEIMVEADNIADSLRKQGVKVHIKAKPKNSGGTFFAFLAGAVLGGIVSVALANSEKKSEKTRRKSEPNR